MKSPIPLSVLDSHLALLGKTGAGKSNAAVFLAERLIDKKHRLCIVDPTDRYWGLRLSADGRGPSGYEPVIFGGQHADLPLEASHGAAIAETVGTTSTPVIISTRLMTVADRTRFWTAFAEVLLRRNEGLLHLVIDEAHLFAPQQGASSSGGAPAMLHATNNLVSLGRGVGLRIMLISQRPAKLHNDSLSQVETLIAFRLLLPHDREAVRRWVREWADEATGAEMMSTLPSLPTGTGWIWSPERDLLRRVSFPLCTTYDSGKPVAAGKKGPELKPIDLAAVRGRLEAVAKDIVENDPRRLKARIAELERQLSNQTAKSDAVSKAELEAQRRAYERGQRDGEFAARSQMLATVGRLTGMVSTLTSELRSVVDELAGQIHDGQHRAPVVTGETQADSAKPLPSPSGLHARAHGGGIVLLPDAGLGDAQPYQPRPPLAVPIGFQTVPIRAVNHNNGALPRGERACLIAIAQHEGGVTRTQLTVLTGYKRSTRDAYLQRLRERGYAVPLVGGRVVATEAGKSYLGADYQPLPTGKALRDYWLRQLPEGERRVLDLLIRAYPDPLDRDSITGATEYRRSTRDAYLQRLRARELVEAAGDGVRAVDALFGGAHG
jgi:hypothetical protein